MNGSEGDGRHDRGGSAIPGLYWAVRESFVDYVAGNPDGQVFGDGGVETDGDGTFRFPLNSVAGSGATWHLRFDGVLRFIAHGGMLDVTLSEPALRLDDGGGGLEVDWGAERRMIVEVSSAGPVELPGGWLVFPSLPTSLTADGAALFGDVYPEGEAFAPLRVALPSEAGA